MEFRKRNIFQKYLDLLFTKFIITIKEFKEYKSNTYSVLIVDILVLSVYVLFLSIYGAIIGNLLNWETYDFLVYYLLMLFEWKFVWLFSLADFKTKLKNGELNSCLNKPINPFFYFSITKMNSATIITTLILFVSTIFFLFYGDYSHEILALSVALLGGFYFVIFFDFLESTSFFMKENSFLVLTGQKMDSLTKRFTPASFEGLKYNFIYLMPGALGGFFPLMILKNNFIILNYLTYILIVVLTLILGIYIMWKIGLKKYEAFG